MCDGMNEAGFVCLDISVVTWSHHASVFLLSVATGGNFNQKLKVL